MKNNKLKVIEINGFQQSTHDDQWYPKSFILTTDDVETVEKHRGGCVYESSFKEAKSYGIKPSDLRKGECTVDIFSKKDGEWLGAYQVV